MGPKVLVVDDDFELREAIVDLLIEGGFEALSAKDGRDGILEARMHPDLSAIVLDLRMPMMDGSAFRNEQLTDPELARIPVVVLSADRDGATFAAELGVQAVVAKPFRPEALFSALCAAMADAAAEDWKTAV
ncbi:MAG TPA: response regulator [Polyangiales bacterium]|nr:response regulator [Polyangiales bacterium]